MSSFRFALLLSSRYYSLNFNTLILNLNALFFTCCYKRSYGPLGSQYYSNGWCGNLICAVEQNSNDYTFRDFDNTSVAK